MVLDQVKAVSDDSYFTEDHVVFLANKIRALLLKQRYNDDRKEIPRSNFQTICVPMEVGTGTMCEDDYIQAKVEIPATLPISKVKLGDVWGNEIFMVSPERFPYTGNNRWLQNFCYATIDYYGKLYIKSSNPQLKYLKQIEVTAIFENPFEVMEMCSIGGEGCSNLDSKFPLEESLATTLMELCVKYLSAAIYQPADPSNNANDDLSSIQAFIRQNMKDKYLKNADTSSEG
jgi:hypothetical protein